jgi:hypothetical protein
MCSPCFTRCLPAVPNITASIGDGSSLPADLLVGGLFLSVTPATPMHQIRPLHTLNTAEVRQLAADAFNREENPADANPFAEGTQMHEVFMDAYGACEYMAIPVAA